jgi:hypothetical protein
LRIVGLVSCVFSISMLAAGIQVAASPAGSPNQGSLSGLSSTDLRAPVVQATTYAYHNYTEIKNRLIAIAAQHPDISMLYDIGDSWETTQGLADRDILALKISDNVAVDEDEPEVLIDGLHHAREWTASEIALALAINLTDGYHNDTRISWLVDNREIWIVPVVNPDGLDYALATDQWWRKNRHANYDGSFGVDLNRNYGGSMNDDAAGEWGGAGSSHVPSDDIYCGTGPFSEPETQAIRDLVQAHNFALAFDFHSYGNLVMWPWGYSANKTADDADLVRIGNEFAALNGYTAEQSIGLYPTTGDSIDWMYGAEDVYSFCFEVGQSLFHPTSATDVLGIIGENLPPTYLAIEIAGDRQERQFQINHSPISAREYSSAGFPIDANITAARGVDVSATSVTYRVDDGTWSKVSMDRSAGNDTFETTIPAQPVGSVVDYYIVAHDMSGVELTSPRYAPYDSHSFLVTNGSSSIFTLNLVTGWSLVSVPLLGYGYKASTLGLMPGDTVSQWNSTTRVYQSHIVGIPANDFVIAPSAGYWINVPSGTRTLTLYGSVPTATQQRDIDVGIGVGWVLIGFESLKTTWHASDIPEMFSGTITSVAKYNSATKSYTSWLSVIPSIHDFLLVPGQAYWILCDSGVLSYVP